MNPLRQRLVSTALKWQQSYGVAPHITSAISELDAAQLAGMEEADYSRFMQQRSQVAKGFDFEFQNIRYQVKANRPSGNKGSEVTLVAKTKNMHWDKLIWILYNPQYELQEAWLWDAPAYYQKFIHKNVYHQMICD